MTTIRELHSLYIKGYNITEFLRKKLAVDGNTNEIIEIAYELQAGSYVAAMSDEMMREHKREYSYEIARSILSLCKPESILEAGVGEATTLSGVLKGLGYNITCYGFDLSWSRIAYARRWLRDNGIAISTLCTGDFFNIPFASDSIDVVYTSHSIEPNGGNEHAILKELYRVARQYLILLEPGYELADEVAKTRMKSNGYCRNLPAIAVSLGYDVLDHRLFPFAANPLNPTAITIIDKSTDVMQPGHVLACPRYKTPLYESAELMFSPEALTVYPIIGEIPCLKLENGILATRFADIMHND